MEHVRRLTLICLLLAAAACGGSGKAFTAADLPRLLLQPSEAPAGTRYLAAESGPATLEQFPGVDRSRKAFAALGFEGGYVRVFASADQAVTIANGAMVFKDADAASRAVEVQRSVVVPSVTIGAKPLSVDQLGDEAFAFSFTLGPAGKPGAIYFFRLGNAMFLVPGGGAVKPSELQAIARRIAARAQGAGPP